MRKFWQEDWFVIKFKSYNELPEDWGKDKIMLVNFIFNYVKFKNNVLFIGCGIGFIENKLSKMNGN